MALWSWKIVRDGVRTAFATFMTPHYIWAHWPNQTLCAQNSSFPKKHFMPQTTWGLTQTFMNAGSLYLSTLTCPNPDTLSYSFEQLHAAFSSVSSEIFWELCVTESLNGGKWKVESVFPLVLALFISVILRLQQLTQTLLFLVVWGKGARYHLSEEFVEFFWKTIK